MSVNKGRRLQVSRSMGQTLVELEANVEEEIGMMTEMMQHFKWDEIPEERINDKFIRKLAWNGKVMISWMNCKKGCYVPAHHHENEQLTFVVSGRWRFKIDGKTVVVGPNEMLYIPPNMVHEAEAEEDLVAYDIFVPPRQDWIKGEDAYLREVKYEG